jgi:hypothetical protein
MNFMKMPSFYQDRLGINTGKALKKEEHHLSRGNTFEHPPPNDYFGDVEYPDSGLGVQSGGQITVSSLLCFRPLVPVCIPTVYCILICADESPDKTIIWFSR